VVEDGPDEAMVAKRIGGGLTALGGVFIGG
jgi:hypothetical protein